MRSLSLRWISGRQILFCMEFGISICSLNTLQRSLELPAFELDLVFLNIELDV